LSILNPAVARLRLASVGLPLAHPKEFDGVSFGEFPQFGVASNQDGVLLPGRFHGKRVRVRKWDRNGLHVS